MPQFEYPEEPPIDEQFTLLVAEPPSDQYLGSFWEEDPSFVDAHRSNMDFLHTLYQRAGGDTSMLGIERSGATVYDMFRFAVEHATYCETPEEANRLLSCSRIYADVAIPGGGSVPVSGRVEFHEDGKLRFPKKPYHPYNHLNTGEIGSTLTQLLAVTMITEQTGLTVVEEKQLLNLLVEKLNGPHHVMDLINRTRNRLIAADIGMFIAPLMHDLIDHKRWPNRGSHITQVRELVKWENNTIAFKRRHFLTLASVVAHPMQYRHYLSSASV